MKKSLILGMAVALPLTISTQTKSFEFPEKPPFGEFSHN